MSCPDPPEWRKHGQPNFKWLWHSLSKELNRLSEWLGRSSNYFYLILIWIISNQTNLTVQMGTHFHYFHHSVALHCSYLHLQMDDHYLVCFYEFPNDEYIAATKNNVKLWVHGLWVCSQNFNLHPNYIDTLNPFYHTDQSYYVPTQLDDSYIFSFIIFIFLLLIITVIRLLLLRSNKK